MNSKFLSGWYVVYVKSRQEKKVNALLQKLHLQSYLPLAKKMKKWSDRKKLVYEPLFPSYVFVHVNQQYDFSKILAIDGICSFIRFEGKFARVKDEELNNIKVLLSGNYENIEAVNSLPKVGDVRKIRYGLLSGKECEIININNEKKIWVRVDSIHMHILATLPVSNLV